MLAHKIITISPFFFAKKIDVFRQVKLGKKTGNFVVEVISWPRTARAGGMALKK
jgi:hypothetical protein